MSSSWQSQSSEILPLETSGLEETEHEIEESEVGDSETSDLGEAEHEIEE